MLVAISQTEVNIISHGHPKDRILSCCEICYYQYINVSQHLLQASNISGANPASAASLTPWLTNITQPQPITIEPRPVSPTGNPLLQLQL